MTRNSGRWSVAVLAWLTAVCPARVAGWLLSLYVMHGGGLAAGLRFAAPSLGWMLVYIAAGVIYLQVKALRWLVFAGALILGIAGFLRMPEYIHQLTTLNLWHNVLAEGFWETLGCAAIAVASLVHQLLALGDKGAKDR